MTTVDARFTRSDYARLPEGFPAQLLAGSLVKEPSPTYGHQGCVVEVLRRLLMCVESGRIRPGPVDVPIDEHNVFQPDVAVYDVPPPDDATGTVVPRVVFEVVSASSGRRDRGFKRRKYLEAGVAEVWVLDPATNSIERWTATRHDVVRGAESLSSEWIAGLALVPEDLSA